MPITPDQQQRVSRFIWLIALGMTLAVAISYTVANISLDVTTGWQPLALIPVCIVIAFVYRRLRPDRWIATGAETAAQLMIIMLLATLLTYSAATAAYPYRDVELYAADRWLGFDWRAYLAYVNDHPRLGVVLSLAYFSMKLQFALVIGALVAASQFGRVQTYALAIIVALVIAIPVFMVAPAVAYYAHLGIQPADFANLSPSVPYAHIPQLEAMRNGTAHFVRLDNLEGLITFPSFHTTAAVIFCWALWPIRRLRWFVVALNLLLVASTPIDGAHYVIDLLAGAIVAGVAIAVARRLHRFVRDTTWLGINATSAPLQVSTAPDR